MRNISEVNYYKKVYAYGDTPEEVIKELDLLLDGEIEQRDHPINFISISHQVMPCIYMHGEGTTQFFGSLFVIYEENK